MKAIVGLLIQWKEHSVEEKFSTGSLHLQIKTYIIDNKMITEFNVEM